MCVAGSHGRAQVFLLKGETPMLCGRPIIEALGAGDGFFSPPSQAPRCALEGRHNRASWRISPTSLGT